MKRLIQKIVAPTPPKEFYKRALEEMLENRIDHATFARAVADSGGNQDGTKALYIRYRSVELHEESVAAHHAQSEAKIDDAIFAQREEARRAKEVERRFERLHEGLPRLDSDVRQRLFERFKEGDDVRAAIEEAVIRADRKYRIQVWCFFGFIALLAALVLLDGTIKK
jgi:hypothetical protein